MSSIFYYLAPPVFLMAGLAVGYTHGYDVGWKDGKEYERKSHARNADR